EEDAFGPGFGDAVDLKGLGQLGVRHPEVRVRDPLHLDSVALDTGAHLAQEGDVVRLALDEVAERALAGQALVGNGVGQSVPVVGGQALQVALDHLTVSRVAHVVSAPSMMATSTV